MLPSLRQWRRFAMDWRFFQQLSELNFHYLGGPTFVRVSTIRRSCLQQGTQIDLEVTFDAFRNFGDRPWWGFSKGFPKLKKD